jgi:cell division transport system permease protein
MGIGLWWTRLSRRNRAWLRRHSYSFFSSLGVLLQHKTGTLMTVLVLGIAMFLPLGLYTALANLDGMNLHQEDWNAVSIFFKPDTSEAEVSRLAGLLQEKFDPQAVSITSPDQGMVEFREASGFGDALSVLDENPLPWVMQISPRPGSSGDIEASVAVLTGFLDTVESVELVQFDYKWLQRLGRMMELGEAVVLAMVLLFGLATVVVVANTIRLDVASHAEEIEILALVGAGNAFIRQPFLYTGLWYGLMGGVLALGLLALTMLYLGRPLALLLETYDTVFNPQGLGAGNALWVLALSAFLGWAGALISVQRYLKILKVGGLLGRH